ncbi:MAG: DDE transposase, partial [Odoribacter sp.]
CKRFSLVHPTTHYKSARAAYLEVIKHKKRSKSLINRGKLHLLTYLIRDIRSFIDLIAINGTQLFDSLKRNEKKIVGAILNMYHQ